MIHLDSGANTVELVLNDRATLSTPYYVILFQNDNTNERFMCSISDTTVQDYISEFTVTVTSNPTWTSAEVVLSNRGDYHYYVFESENPIDPLAIDYDATIAMTIDEIATSVFTSLVSQGKMNFTAADRTVNTYINTVSSVKAYGD